MPTTLSGSELVNYPSTDASGAAVLVQIPYRDKIEFDFLKELNFRISQNG